MMMTIIILIIIVIIINGFSMLCFICKLLMLACFLLKQEQERKYVHSLYHP